MRSTSKTCAADDVIAALRVDGPPPDTALVDTALVERCETLRRTGRLSCKKYAGILVPLLHKCLPRHPTGGNCPRHHATLYTLLFDVRPLDKKILNRLRLMLFQGIDCEGPRIEKELGLVAATKPTAVVPGWLCMEDA